jgi:adenosylcobinamide kinase/adenosylcobinamide-phosphate guanylyltransferase
VEEPIALSRVVQTREDNRDAILIECLTFFDANLMEAYGGNDANLEACVEDLCAALKTTSRKVIMVSNEVGSSVVPAYELGRRVFTGMNSFGIRSLS